MDILTGVKTLIGTACAGSLIAMAFLAITPAGWFLGFCSAPLVWLFGEGVVKTGLKLVKGQPIDDTK